MNGEVIDGIAHAPNPDKGHSLGSLELAGGQENGPHASSSERIYALLDLTHRTQVSSEGDFSHGGGMRRQRPSQVGPRDC